MLRCSCARRAPARCSSALSALGAGTISAPISATDTRPPTSSFNLLRSESDITPVHRRMALSRPMMHLSNHEPLPQSQQRAGAAGSSSTSSPGQSQLDGSDLSLAGRERRWLRSKWSDESAIELYPAL
eukprot:3955587-Prymnesium_polylepis.2